MSKHTPGPWVVESTAKTPNRMDDLIRTQDGDRMIAWSYSTCPANAHLIAAAPEMLEALEPFAALLQDHNDIDEYGKPRRNDQPIFAINSATITVGDLRKARAAIAKAKGESK